MAEKLEQDGPPDQDIANALKGWVMIALTLAFVSLYGAALTGWLKPLADEKMVMRLEPIIFVIIGYYFGRLPAQQNEKTLKDEVTRQTQKSDAAQHAKEQAQQAREALEEKVKNAHTALTAAMPGTAPKGMADAKQEKTAAAAGEELSHSAVFAALRILNP
jgi:hypothetical protein